MCVCALAGARECARTCNRACVRARMCLCERDRVHMRACVRMRVGAHTSALEGARSHTCDRACGCAYVPRP